MNLPNTRDEAFKLAVDLVASGLMQRGERVPIEEVRRRLDAVQDGIEAMLERRAAADAVAVPNNLK